MPESDSDGADFGLAAALTILLRTDGVVLRAPVSCPPVQFRCATVPAFPAKEPGGSLPALSPRTIQISLCKMKKMDHHVPTMGPAAPTRDRYLVKSIVHSSQLLSAFHLPGEALALKEICSRCALPKTMVFRLLYT